jgi:hypothetical protein
MDQQPDGTKKEGRPHPAGHPDLTLLQKFKYF